MNDPIKELEEILREARVRVHFGLVAQGHIPIIEAALKAGEQWSEIIVFADILFPQPRPSAQPPLWLSWRGDVAVMEGRS